MKEIELSNGGVALVDESEYEAVNQFIWRKNNNGYAVRNTTVDGVYRTLYMHKVILDAPKGYVTDHINQNKLDNRGLNLRVATRSQNGANCGPKGNRSGHKGVWERNGKWMGYIRVHGKTLHLGTHSTLTDAAKSYNEAAIAHFGEYASLNII